MSGEPLRRVRRQAQGEEAAARQARGVYTARIDPVIPFQRGEQLAHEADIVAVKRM